jgi:hypothetical protein
VPHFAALEDTEGLAALPEASGLSAGQMNSVSERVDWERALMSLDFAIEMHFAAGSCRVNDQNT